MSRALILSLLAVGLAYSAAPPARLTSQQMNLLRSRPLFFTSAKTLEIELRVYGPWHKQVEQSALALAGQHESSRRWKEAADHYRLVVESRRRLNGEGHWQTTDAHWSLRTVELRARWADRQHQDWEKAVRLLGEAFQLFKGGKHSRALPLAKEALALRRSVVGNRHPLIAHNVFIIGMLHREAGDLELARARFREALELSVEALGEKHPFNAQALNDYANLLFKLGHPAASLVQLQRARAITRATLGESDGKYALVLTNLASMSAENGDHRAALAHLETALAVKERLGERDAEYAAAIGTLAELHRLIGDNRKALALASRALELTRKVGGGDHPQVATLQSALAMAHCGLGDYKTALPLLQQALAARKKHLKETHPDYILSLNNLAELYQKLQDHPRAVALFREALALAREGVGESSPLYASILNNLAIESLTNGDDDRAITLTNQALTIVEKAWPTHPHRARGLMSLAQAYQFKGARKRAVSLAEEAVHLTTAHFRAVAGLQSDRQQLASLRESRPHLDLRLSMDAPTAYHHVLSSKGAVLLRQRQRRLFTALSADPTARETTHALQAVTHRIAAASTSPTATPEQWKALTDEQERLQRRLSTLSSEARAAFAEKALGPEALARTLPPGAVLVDYFIYDKHSFSPAARRMAAEGHLAAYVSRRGKPAVYADLGPVDQVEAAVLAWRTAVTRGEPGITAGARLKALVWSPLEKHLKGATIALVSPDGLLAGVPFAALPGSKERTYLIEDLAIAVVPVPQMLPELLGTKDRKSGPRPSLLAVSDVEYDRPRASVRSGPLAVSRAWPTLAATRIEADDLKARFTALFKGGLVTDLRGRAATRARMREALPNHRYAHIATHGFFAAEDIRSAEGTRGHPGGDEMIGWHPLLLSGIVLAGANREPGPGEEDGILTALEVSEMQLPNLELVVLSACETGLGKTAGGEGLLGLQRAFQVAGARTVIASLWSVDDRATQALMAELYRAAWNEKSPVSKADALRRAQLALMRGTIAGGTLRGLARKAEKLPAGEKSPPGLPPLYWAAFVLSGDWR